MKIFKNFLLNPLWVLDFCSKAVFGQGIGNMVAGAVQGTVGLGLLGGGLASRKNIPLPQPATAEELSTRGINLRKDDAFPRILDTRREFDSQFLRADERQLQLADMIRRNMIEDDILPSISRQRADLNIRDIKNFNDILRSEGGNFRSGLLALSPELAGADTGFQQDLGLLNQLRAQASEDLALRGQLSGEDIRAVEQQTASAVGRRGRGAGAFGVGQLALNRQSARDAREAQRRNFAANTIGLGGQFQDRAQRQSDLFTRPFLNLLSQTQAANRGVVGTPEQALASSRSIAAQGTPNIPVVDPQLLQLEGLTFGGLSQQAQGKQDRADRFSNALIGGGIGQFGQSFQTFTGGSGGGGGLGSLFS